METIQEVLRRANTRLTTQAAAIIDKLQLELAEVRGLWEQERNISDILAEELEGTKQDLYNAQLELSLNSND